MATGRLMKTTVILGEFDTTYGTYVIYEGITAESYLADPAAPGVREGADTVLRSELEYMGQTEPTEAPLPSGETGETGLPGESAPPAEPSGDLAADSGSLVFSDDPEKPDE